MGLHGKSKRQQSAMVAAGGADLISDLGDDVLLRILALVPDTRDAVRTDALSRRWRRLWTRLPALRFDSSLRPEFSGPKPDRYISFVNDALALRARDDAAVLEHLAISLIVPRNLVAHHQSRMRPDEEEEDARPAIMEAASLWIRHAFQRAVKSFVLEVRLPPRFPDRSLIMVLNDLPNSAKLETMRLALKHAHVCLPAAAVYTSLTDLSLEDMDLSTGQLNRILSPACCPVLQKLLLRNLGSDEHHQDLLIESPTLLELSLDDVWGWRILKLATSSLRVLRAESCCVDMLHVSAPRLEEIWFSKERPYGFEIDGELPCMADLNIDLVSHGSSHSQEDNERINDVSITLLQRCTSASYLDVSLQVTESGQQALSDDIITGRIPHLPHVKYLTVYIELPVLELHSFGVGIENILKQCNNLTYLRVHCWTMEKLSTYILAVAGRRKMGITDEPEPNFLCNHPDPWQSHDQISLIHLEEVEFTGLVGTDCELGFMQYVLSSATQLKKVNVSFNPVCIQKSMRDAFKLIPQLGGGVWTADDGRDNGWSYEWKPFVNRKL